MGFKENYYKLVRKNKLTFAEVGRFCGVSKGSAWAWAHSRELPTIEHLKQLGDLFHVSIEDLIKDDEESNTATTESNSITESNNNDFLIAMDALSYNLSEADKRTLLNIASSLIDARKESK